MTGAGADKHSAIAAWRNAKIQLQLEIAVRAGSDKPPAAGPVALKDAFDDLPIIGRRR
jgi:hypothetical protein